MSFRVSGISQKIYHLSEDRGRGQESKLEVAVSLSPFYLPSPLLPTPYSLLPTPYSLLPTPYSLLPTPYSLPLELSQQGRTQFVFEFDFAFLGGNNSLSDNALAVKTNCV
ncbi:hypothetical protein F8S12_11610 [Nostoc sp. WHI]|nr:hypothetical protein [Nostoc sp. WHI]